MSRHYLDDETELYDDWKDFRAMPLVFQVLFGFVLVALVTLGVLIGWTA